MYGNEHVTQAIQMERGHKEHPANSAARVTTGSPFRRPCQMAISSRGHTFTLSSRARRAAVRKLL